MASGPCRGSVLGESEHVFEDTGFIALPASNHAMRAKDKCVAAARQDGINGP